MESVQEINLVIWQNFIDHHLFYTWDAVQSSLKIPPIFIVGKDASDIRLSMGWSPQNLDKLQIYYVSSNELKKKGKEILESYPDAIHVFCGFRGAPGYDYFSLILHSLRLGIKIAILNEAYSVSSLGYFKHEAKFISTFKVWARPLLYKIIMFLIKSFTTSHDPCIFPLSPIAFEQFRKSGIAPQNLYSFGYFVSKQQISNDFHTPSPSGLNIIYLGALIPRKGVDILVEVVSRLFEKGFDVKLDLYGHGDIEKIENVTEAINYKGILPLNQVQTTIAKYNLLVLPSRHDGWGIVVNEALLQGVPVIVSDRVGAKCLLESSQAGLVFCNDDSNDLMGKIKLLIESPEELIRLQKNAAKMSEKIKPEIAAKYFLDVISFHFFHVGTRPDEIWNLKD